MIHRASRAAALFILAATAACASSLDQAQGAHLRGDYEEAETLYRKALQNESYEEAAEQGMADLHADLANEQAATDPDAAERLYRKALDRRPGHDAALTGLVRLLRAQKRMKDATRVVDEAKASGKCGGSCGRLELVLLLDQGDAALAAKRWDEALAAYGAAQKVREQPAVAVAIAATHLGANELAKAEADLVAVHPMMLGVDASTIDRFVRIRRGLIDRVLAEGDVEAADRLRAIQLRDEPATRHTELALLVAETLYQSTEPARALERFDELLQATGDGALDELQKATTAKKAAQIHARRGTRSLHEGLAEEADLALKAAIALQPDDWSLKLQRILALSEMSGAVPALESLSQVPSTAVGVAHVRAILLSLRVREEVARREYEVARATLDAAEQVNPDLPEVHLASAMLLAYTPSDELSGSERRALLSGPSMVTYRGAVFRFGEALAELDWVRQAVADRTKDYPFTAPWLTSATDALRSALRSVYPMPVEFQEEPEPIVVFTNGGDEFVRVSVSGPEGLREQLSIAPQGEHVLAVPAAGLLRMTIGRKKKVLYAEGYTRVTIDVG